MRRQLHARLAISTLLAAYACGLVAAAQVPQDIAAVMRLVGERVAEYHRLLQNVMCVERSTVQPIASGLSPDGFSRTVESELRVEFDGEGGTQATAHVVREIRRINGRAPRERDKKDRSGCTDPNPMSPEPLAFLLPAHRDEYRFTSIRSGKEKDRAALIIDFVSAERTNRPELIEDEHGHDDCFDWTGLISTRGRVWVDATTHDVLRVDRRIDGPVDLRVPWPLQRRHNLPAWVVLERDDQTMRYKPVAFGDPDEVMMLPASIESLTVLRSGLQSIRRIETFSDYRRFVTDGRIVKEP
jgi:hypothetical protein